MRFNPIFCHWSKNTDVIKKFGQHFFLYFSESYCWFPIFRINFSFVSTVLKILDRGNVIPHYLTYMEKLNRNRVHRNVKNRKRTYHIDNNRNMINLLGALQGKVWWHYSTYFRAWKHELDENYCVIAWMINLASSLIR